MSGPKDREPVGATPASPCPRIEFLGARGSFGREMTRALASAAGAEVKPWSGAEGDASYEAFVSGWRRRTAAERVVAVVLAFGSSHGDWSALVAQHVARTAALVDAWNGAGWPRRVVAVGSAAELLPRSPYGACKRMQRVLLEEAAPAGVLRAIRVHSVVPDAAPTRGLPADLLRQFRAGSPVVVHHLGGARDYVSVEQVALAVLAAGSDAAREGARRVVDVGNGVPVRVTDWVTAFRAAFMSDAAVAEKFPGFDDPEIVADTSPLEALLASQGRSWVERYHRAAPSLEAAVRRWKDSAE